MEEYIEEVVKYSFETRRENLAASAAAEYMSADEFLLRFPEKNDLSKPQVFNRLENDYSQYLHQWELFFHLEA